MASKAAQASISADQVVGFIKQRRDDDCAICCLAMLTGRAYQDVAETIGDAYVPGKGVGSVQRALNRLGFDCFDVWVEPQNDVLTMLRPSTLDRGYFRWLAWGRRALVTVPSLNRERHRHMVFYDGERVWDPSLGRVYEGFHDLQPEELVLFRESWRGHHGRG